MKPGFATQPPQDQELLPLDWPWKRPRFAIWLPLGQILLSLDRPWEKPGFAIQLPQNPIPSATWQFPIHSHVLNRHTTARTSNTSMHLTGLTTEYTGQTRHAD